jgi:hypothetical protein
LPPSSRAASKKSYRCAASQMAKKRNTLWPAATLPSVAVTFTVDEKRFAVIRPLEAPHVGKRVRWRQHEYVQLAVQVVCGCSPREDINQSELTERVNAWLAQDAGYQALPIKNKKVSRWTVRRVLKMMRP